MENLTNNQKLIKNIISQEYKESEYFDNENSFFEYFSALQILKDYNFNDDEIINGITAGAKDGGCDSIYVLLDNELITIDQVENLSATKNSILNLIIIQSKYKNSFSEDVILKWKDISEKLMDVSVEINDFNNFYNENVLNSFYTFNNAINKLIRYQIHIHINYYYVSYANQQHDNVKNQANELVEKVNKIYPSAVVNVNFIGADKLMNLYNSDAEIYEELTFVDNPIGLGKNNDYVALVNLVTYYNFITDENKKLRNRFFDANVRDYQGKNSVNSSIADTLLKNKTEDFWWLNNGITILADEIKPITNKKYTIKNPIIVNGLQTSNEIFNYFGLDKSLIENENRNLLIRLIVPNSEESRDKIIFATNNQTNIPKSSLRVTDPIHLQIELFLKNKGLYYDRRKNYYKNQKKKISEIVSVSFLAQCLISVFLQKPDFARARPSTLLTNDETYNKLYAPNTELDVYYKTAYLGKKIQKNLSNTEKITSAEKNDILYYLLYAVSVKLFKKRNIEFYDMLNLKIELISDDLINELKNRVYDKYKEMGGNGRVAKNKDFIKEIDKILGY